MRRSGYAADLKRVGTAPRVTPAGAGASEYALLQPLAAPATRITLDQDSMRAAGYLPEATRGALFADQFRHIKRPLIEKAVSDPSAPQLRLILVTSALAGDGKTFTSINLALSMARERDTSVLLIDADMRNPSASRILGVAGGRGLLDALSDDSLDVGSLIQGTSVPGLDILPAGNPVDHASELLASDRMTQIAAQICANPRYLVVIDCAPVLLTSEAGALAPLVGQIVLVARAGKTPQQALLDAIRQLDGSKLSGIVLNDSKADPGGYHYYGYGNYGTQERGSTTGS
jgi:exopolysaccharide/PEP-CTERM locus tyrosine autokinase